MARRWPIWLYLTPNRVDPNWRIRAVIDLNGDGQNKSRLATSGWLGWRVADNRNKGCKDDLLEPQPRRPQLATGDRDRVMSGSAVGCGHNLKRLDVQHGGRTHHAPHSDCHRDAVAHRAGFRSDALVRTGAGADHTSVRIRNPYKPSDAALLRDFGATLVAHTPLQELRRLDPYKPSEAALLRQLGGAFPLWGLEWYWAPAARAADAIRGTREMDAACAGRPAADADTGGHRAGECRRRGDDTCAAIHHGQSPRAGEQRRRLDRVTRRSAGSSMGVLFPYESSAFQARRRVRQRSRCSGGRASTKT